MKDATAEAMLETMETMDRRMVAMEGYSAEAAQAVQEMSKGQTKLQELYVQMSQDISDLKDMFSNYLEATKANREESRAAKNEAVKLVSEVREKLKACP